MHRVIRDHLEEMLAESRTVSRRAPGRTSKECEDCRGEVAAMREQAALLRVLRTPSEAQVEPRAGFYARVMERIEAEGPVSIWNVFIESTFGRRIAMASMALALLLGVYVVTAEQMRNRHSRPFSSSPEKTSRESGDGTSRALRIGTPFW